MKIASVASKGVVAKKCAIRAFFLRSWGAPLVPARGKEPRNSCACGRRERGVHLHLRGDGKSAETIETKRVVQAPLRKGVWKRLEVKELNGGKELDDTWVGKSLRQRPIRVESTKLINECSIESAG